MTKVNILLTLILSVLLTTGLFLGQAGAAAGDVNKISRTAAGVDFNHQSTRSVISGDGRYVAFESQASNVVSGDTNNEVDVFVKDRTSGAVTLVSVSTSGGVGNYGGWWPRISYDGRYVSFASYSDNLVGGDTNGVQDIFVRDMINNTTTRVSVSASGTQANSSSYYQDISADGRYLVFGSYATNLVSSPTVNGNSDLFYKDLQTGGIKAITANSSGGNFLPSISCDGARVVFRSQSTSIVSNDTNGMEDIFLYSANSIGSEIQNITILANSYNSNPYISCDGNHIVFTSQATNLDPNGPPSITNWQTFEYNIATKQFKILSVSTGGTLANAQVLPGGVSDNGRYVAMSSTASNLTSGDTNGKKDLFIRDTKNNTTTRIALANSAAEGGAESISHDGSVVTYSSANKFIMSPEDPNGIMDVFTISTGL